MILFQYIPIFQEILTSNFLYMQNLLYKNKNIFTFSTIFHHWDEAASWNPSSCFCLLNAMAAAYLVT